MSNVNAVVNDGKITNLTNDTETKKKDSSSSVDKEQFLQLLVAQMKYQDPLEPTDNTQYVSQLATFSELEQMQNVARSSDMQRATSMVGSLVTVTATNEVTGATTEVTGKVDFVSKSGNSIKLSINDALYDLDDVKQIWDNSYADARALAEEWTDSFNTMPTLDNITAKNADIYKGTLKTLYDTYQDMSIYQKTFLSSESQSLLGQYVEKFLEYGIDVTKSDFGQSSSGNSSSSNSGSSENSSSDSGSTNAGSSVGTANGTGSDTGTGVAAV